MQSWCECWAIITFRAQGSDSGAVNADHGVQRAECLLGTCSTVSKVLQQDLGWVAGDPNDCSPDSGASQWMFWPSRVKLAEFSTLRWAIPHHCSWFVDHQAIEEPAYFMWIWFQVLRSLCRIIWSQRHYGRVVLMPGANLSEHYIGGMALPGA